MSLTATSARRHHSSPTSRSWRPVRRGPRGSPASRANLCASSAARRPADLSRAAEHGQGQVRAELPSARRCSSTSHRLRQRGKRPRPSCST
jgi:hypothetical protein